MRLPHLERVWSLSVPTKMVVRVATIALAATIQETGRGSGVMVSNTKVLNQVFSTAQAICPVTASAIITAHVRVDIFDVALGFVFKMMPSYSWCSYSKLLWQFCGLGCQLSSLNKEG